MAVRDQTFGFEGGENGDVQLFREADDALHVEARTMADDDHRTFRLFDLIDRGLEDARWRRDTEIRHAPFGTACGAVGVVHFLDFVGQGEGDGVAGEEG